MAAILKNSNSDISTRASNTGIPNTGILPEMWAVLIPVLYYVIPSLPVLTISPASSLH